MITVIVMLPDFEYTTPIEVLVDFDKDTMFYLDKAIMFYLVILILGLLISLFIILILSILLNLKEFVYLLSSEPSSILMF